MRDTERKRQRHRQREKQAPCREPDVGFDLRTPGSTPEPKADAQPLSCPGAPDPSLLKVISVSPQTGFWFLFLASSANFYHSCYCIELNYLLSCLCLLL